MEPGWSKSGVPLFIVTLLVKDVEKINFKKPGLHDPIIFVTIITYIVQLG